MTFVARFAAVWRRLGAFLEALENAGLDPLESQRRRIASLEKRIAALETANDDC